MSNRVFLSLGSNVGDRESNLASAISALMTYNEIHDLTSASFYETEPVGDPTLSMFLNTVIEVQVDFTPERLLEATQHTEEILGRPHEHGKNKPRTIDIDILCYDQTIVSLPNLKIPHPEMAGRRFVLIPFAEIAADFHVPGWNRTVAFLLEHCADQSHVYKYHLQKNA